MEFSRLEEQLIKSAYPDQIADQLMAGHFEAAVMKLADDEGGNDLADLLAEPGPNPVDLCAMLMLAEAFSTPEAFHDARQSGAFTIIDCERLDWIGPLTTMIARLLKPFGRAVSNPSADYLTKYSSAYHILLSPSEIEDGNFGSSSKKKPAVVENSHILECIASRRPIIAFSTVAPSALPSWTRAVCRANLTIPSPGQAVLSKLLHMMCLTSPGTELPPIAGLSPQQIAIALSATIDATAAIERLTMMHLADGPPQPGDSPASLDDLIGMAALKRWAERLKIDIDAVRTGTLGLTQLPRGLLLSGRPGTGKSKGARIVAGYAGMPVIFGSVGRWISVGDGHLGTFVRAMRADFVKAAATSPSMMIIDEIDAFPARGNKDSWFDAALTALLEAMDGLDSAPGVVTVGICNNPNGLDPALRRAGRFDHHVEIQEPGVQDLAEMFSMCLRPDLQDADYLPLAAMIIGGTIADVDRICKDARRLARNSQRPIDINDVKQVVLDGLIEATPAERQRTALHEAAHALIAHVESIKIRWVSISMAGLDGNRGSVMADLSNRGWTLDEVNQVVRLMLAGHAAEVAFLGGATFGADQDLEMATSLLARAAASEGLMGSLVWRDPTRLKDVDRVPGLARIIDTVLETQHKLVSQILVDNRKALFSLRDVLAERMFLDQPEVASLLSEVLVDEPLARAGGLAE